MPKWRPAVENSCRDFVIYQISLYGRFANHLHTHIMRTIEHTHTHKPISTRKIILYMVYNATVDVQAK